MKLIKPTPPRWMRAYIMLDSRRLGRWDNSRRLIYLFENWPFGVVSLVTFQIRRFEQLGTNFTILPNSKYLCFFRFIMPNNVTVRSAIPTNNLFRLKLAFLQDFFFYKSTWKITWKKLQAGRSTSYTCLSLLSFWILASYRLKSSVGGWAKLI